MAKAPKRSAAKPDFTIQAVGAGTKGLSLSFEPSPEFAMMLKAAWKNADTTEGESVAFVYDRLAHAVDAWFGNHKPNASKGVKYSIKRG